MPVKRQERDIQRSSILALEKMGCMCLKQESKHRRGVPDVLVLFPWGEYCFIEFKTEDGVLMPIQVKYFEKLTEKARARIYISRSTSDTKKIYQALVKEVTKRLEFKVA